MSEHTWCHIKGRLLGHRLKPLPVFRRNCITEEIASAMPWRSWNPNWNNNNNNNNNKQQHDILSTRTIDFHDFPSSENPSIQTTSIAKSLEPAWSPVACWPLASVNWTDGIGAIWILISHMVPKCLGRLRQDEDLVKPCVWDYDYDYDGWISEQMQATADKPRISSWWLQPN